MPETANFRGGLGRLSGDAGPGRAIRFAEPKLPLPPLDDLQRWATRYRLQIQTEPPAQTVSSSAQPARVAAPLPSARGPGGFHILLPVRGAPCAAGPGRQDRAGLLEMTSVPTRDRLYAPSGASAKRIPSVRVYAQLPPLLRVRLYPHTCRCRSRCLPFVIY